MSQPRNKKIIKVAAVKFISKVNFLDEYNKTKNKKGSPDPEG